MSQIFEVDEKESATYTATIVDEEQERIPASNLSSLTLTLVDEASRNIINNRNEQNVLNANNVTVNETGDITWLLQSLDNIIINDLLAANSVERHIATFNFTWSNGSKSNFHVFYIDVTRILELPSFYGSVEDGDNYFSTRLNSDIWNDSTDANKRIALIEATRLIDRLGFKGEKTESTQALQFPRDGDDSIPRAIQQATYEIAIKLLDGVDPDLEADNIGTLALGYSSVRIMQTANFVSEYKLAGIPSSRAWNLIKPFLLDTRTIKMRRV